VAASGGFHCSSTPPPCRASGIDRAVACTTLQLAAAAEGDFDRHNTYQSGNCTDLPGVTIPKGMVCTMTGTASTFAVVVDDPASSAPCTWRSAPSEGAPHLDCRGQ